MSPLLIETIKCHNGKLCNLGFHQCRFDLARKSLLSTPTKILLSETIEIPEEAGIGLFRCRVLYADEIEKIEFLPHRYRKVNSLKLIEDNFIDYRFKLSDRQKLSQLFEQRGDCDDILIVKNGCITDSYTANSVFFDGKIWWTPDTPLLPGTQRARLISEKKIKVCRIEVSDLPKYQKAGLINAMQDLENMPVLTINNIKF